MQGDLDGALRMHQERMQTVQALLAKSPAPNLRYSLAASLNALGDLYRTLGQNSQALDYNRRALAIREKLLAADPRSERARRLVGISHEGIGYALDAMADYGGAAREHEKALALFESLAAGDRMNADLQRLVFVAADNACQTLAESGAASKAIPRCRQGSAIAESMYRSDPANAQAAQDLGSAYSTMSVALEASGRPRDALVWEQRAQPLLRAALARDSDSIEAAAAYVDDLLNLAALDRRLQRSRGCEHARAGLDLLTQTLARAPRDATLTVRLAKARRLMAACQP
jgi:tetratricopeptide (TPR) repeat protein